MGANLIYSYHFFCGSFLLITFCALSFWVRGEEVSVRFGEIEIQERIGSDGYRFQFLRQVDRVPLFTFSEGGLYGLEYRSLDDRKYTSQVRAIVPKGADVGRGDIISIESDTERTIIQFKPLVMTGTVVEPFLFSKGDPPGEYILQISVGGKLHTTIAYEAYIYELLP